MTGKKEGKYYIGPHVIGRYIINPKEAVDTFFGKKKPRTKSMEQGTDWHLKLGYDNEELFERETVIEGVPVVIRGIPDYIGDDGIAELKTVPSKYVSDRYLEAAEVQMLTYLWLTNRPNGRVVVVNRNDGEIIEEFPVLRDDKRLFNIVSAYIHDIKRREKEANGLSKWLNG